jgi:hypothetical protein
VADITFTLSGEQHCKVWLENYTLTNAMIFIMAAGIILINIILKLVLRKLSQFEKRHTKTEEISASTIKMFIAQLINTGIIIMIVNANLNLDDLPDSFPIFNGSYAEFDIEWYKNVGTTIALTMVLTIFSPHLAKLIFMA